MAQDPPVHDQHYYPLAIAAVVEETHDTKSFVLDVPPALAETFAYVAGQFCTFRAVIGADEGGEDGGEEVVRCYSMSSSPDVDDRFVTTVKRVPGGKMSNWMLDTLAPGDTIEVMAPSGLFVLRDTDAPIVAFAGGSGITPVISIVKRALATTTRRITLVYANRDESSVIFADALEALRAGSGGRLTLHHHLDSAGGHLDSAGGHLDSAGGHLDSAGGFLTPADCTALVGDDTGADFYVCGPGPFMDTVEAGLAPIGLSPAQLFIERFVVPGEHTIDERSSTETVTVVINRVKKVVEYRAGDTLLDTARRGGLRPPFSCESGSCATCMAHLDEGAANMRVNNALRPDEVDDGWVLTCQALPRSRTVVVNYDA
jgi:ferredoxin-NADP reductase